MLRLTSALSLFLVAQSLAQQPTDAKQKSDQELLQGNWDIVGLDSGGKSELTSNYKGNRFSFGKEKATLKEGSYTPIEYSFALDSAKSPKTIDLTIKGNVLRGIYKLEKEDLVLCISMGGPRPTEFASKAPDCERITLKRSRWEKYTDKQFGFSVELPGKPEVVTRELEMTTGKVTTTFLAVRGDSKAPNYLVSVMPRKQEDKEWDETAMDILKKAMLAELSLAMPKSSTEPKSPASGVRDWTLTFDAVGSMEKVTTKIRFLVTGDKIYGLLATGGEEFASRQRPNIVSLFWHSFEPGQAKP
jgi:uncharacterized protein (TIGR03067 family)